MPSARVGTLVLLLLASATALLVLPCATAHARARGVRSGSPSLYTTWEAEATAERVQRCLAAKEEAGLGYDELAAVLGLTNTYTAQLLLGQAQLKPATAEKLRAALPALGDADVEAMQGAPMRGFDEAILKEPNVYRTYEAVTHYGLAIKSIINEQCGDGIMSAIDFYMDVGTSTGEQASTCAEATWRGHVLRLRALRSHCAGLCWCILMHDRRRAGGEARRDH